MLRPRFLAHSAIVVLVLALLASSLWRVEGAQEIDEATAIAALSDAEAGLLSAYKAVVRAEAAGANVSLLTEALTNSAMNLTRAWSLLEEQDYNEVLYLAETCQAAAAAVTLQATSLSDAGTANKFSVELLTSLWIIAVGITLAATFLSWRAFTKWYKQRLLGMRPEATSHEY